VPIFSSICHTVCTAQGWLWLYSTTLKTVVVADTAALVEWLTTHAVQLQGKFVNQSPGHCAGKPPSVNSCSTSRCQHAPGAQLTAVCCTVTTMYHTTAHTVAPCHTTTTSAPEKLVNFITLLTSYHHRGTLTGWHAPICAWWAVTQSCFQAAPAAASWSVTSSCCWYYQAVVQEGESGAGTLKPSSNAVVHVYRAQATASALCS